MSTSIKIDDALEIMPDYLKRNDYFRETLKNNISPLKRLDMHKKKGGYFFFSPFNVDINDYFPVVISFSKKGTFEMDVEKKETIINESKRPEFKQTKKQVLAVKEKDGTYSISVRTISTLTKRYGIFSSEVIRQQTFEKRNYDHNGEIIQAVVREYDQEYKEVREDSALTWDEALPYTETSTYYLGPTDAIIEKTKSNSDEKETAYVTFENGEVVSSQPLVGDAYKECFDKYEEKRFETKAEARAKTKQLKKVNQ